MYESYTKNVNGIKTKGNKHYVSNPAFYDEIVKSRKQGKLTDNAIKMIILICTNLKKNDQYKDSADREDCIQFAILDCIKYWDRFDPDKGKNPFAYFTSVATNGYAKAWRKLGYYDFPASIMSSLDGIHSI